MNLFAFYRDTVLQYLGKPELDGEDLSRILAAAKSIKSAYFHHEPMDYSGHYARLAYMLYFAPKHAVIWREYMRNYEGSIPLVLKANSIGTACGPEIIGIMEGLGATRPIKSEWCCLDTEPGWQDLLNITLERYTRLRGTEIVAECVSKITHLKAGSNVFGSLVLSEIVKQKATAEFTKGIARAVRPAEGWFLDISRCTLPDGSEAYISDYYRHYGYASLRNNDMGLKSIINKEISECKPSWCLSEITSEPGLLMFYPRFR